MHPRLSHKRNAAMTLFEVGVVIAIVVILAAVFFREIISTIIQNSQRNELSASTT